MKSYTVTIPIAGHCTVYFVEAADEESAKKEAINMWDLKPESCEITWEFLDSFGEGNVCHCPTPWETEIEEDE